MDGVLEQVVDNLVDNAVAASAEGTEVVVSAEAHGQHVRIAITDAGRGMTPEEIQHAFDRFWRSTRSAPGAGSGLGLAIVKEIADRHAAIVSIDSPSSSKGTLVRVSFRRLRNPPAFEPSELRPIRATAS